MAGIEAGGMAIILALAAAGAAGGVADELQTRLGELEEKSSTDEARIAELEARLAALESASGERWLTEQRAEQIRSLVADVLADADSRSSLLANGIDAGYDDGAVIATGNGDWRLKTNILLQLRFLLNNQSGSATDSTRWGFDNPRTKFILTGNVVKPEWFYKVVIETSPVNTGLPNDESRVGLLDALAGYDFGNGWKVGVGTFKTPLLREELVESQNQLAAERSVVNYIYTGGYTDGVGVDYFGDRLHFTGSINNGINDEVYGGDLMTGGTSPISSPTAEFAFSLRAEYLFQGEWDQMTDFTSLRDEKPAMMLGGAMHYQAADDDAPGVDDIDLLVLTVDFQGEFSGISTFGALIFANADEPGGGDTSAIAFVAQGAYRFTEDWEGFARYEWSDLDTIASDDINIITLGVTRYFAGNRAKWTTDLGIGFTREPFNVPVAGWRGDPSGEDGQVVIRSQLQLVF